MKEVSEIVDRHYDTICRWMDWYRECGLSEVSERLPGQPVPTYAHMMQYVFSQTLPEYTHEQLRVIRDDPTDFVRQLKAESGEAIYLCGGGQLAGYLLKHKLVDALILKLNPVAFGCGIPVFGDLQQSINLSLLDTKIYNNGAVYLHYSISDAM